MVTADARPRRNIALLLEYDGSRFHGWQSQINAAAVQDLVASAIDCLEDEPVKLTGASRTDAGVHAWGQVANFFTQSGIPGPKYAYALNNLLPNGITCVGSWEAPQDFHARFSAKGKAYSYLILNSRFPSALLRKRAWHVPAPLDIAAMREAAALLTGERDFKAFMAAGSPVQSTVRTIWSLQILEEAPQIGGNTPWARDAPTVSNVPAMPDASDASDARDAPDVFGVPDAPDIPDVSDVPDTPGRRLVRIHVRGNGFLYNMVRIIVGTLVYVGMGRFSTADVAAALRSGDRKAAGKTAPPQGLYLDQVYYSGEER